MPLDIRTHTDYSKHVKDWEQIETCLDGESFIKEKGETYLPYPVAVTAEYRKTPEFNEEYKVYLAGAHYVNFTLQAVEDLVAGVFRKAPKVEGVPTQLEYVDYKDFSKESVKLVTSYGRMLALVDYPVTEEGTTKGKEAKGKIQAYYVLYKAKDILDWEITRVGGVEVLSMVYLKESFDGLNDEGVKEVQFRYRKLYLEDGVYMVDLEYEDTAKNETFTPRANGTTIDHIPATFVGSDNNTPRVNTSPVIGISNTNIKHYQTWGEVKHIETYAGHPMLSITGAPKNFVKEMEENGVKISVGASNALVLEGTEAKAEVLSQANAGNIMHFEELDVLKASMKEQGARIKDSGSGQVESADTLTIKYSGDNSILASIAYNVELALLFVYQEMAMFMGADTTKITATLNKTFFEKKADPAIMTGLGGLASMGKIQDKTLIEYLQDHNLINDDEDVEAYVQALKSESPFPTEV